MALPPLAHSILETIGATPCVELHRVVKALGLRGRLIAKLEYFAPGGSKKDRVALEIVRRAREEGELRPGQPVVELTSGNTGAGLALVCSALGHPFAAVMSRGNSPERAQQMRALGAEVVLVDQAPGATPGQVSGEDLALAAEVAARLVEERRAFRAHQFERLGSVLAHELGTGPELWEQTGRSIDVYVDCPGTSGSLTGVAKALKKRCEAVRIYAVEPDGAAVLAGCDVEAAAHRIQGAGYARRDLPLFDASLVSGFVQVTDEEATAAARLLAREEGILGGFSTGAHLAAACKLLNEGEAGKTVAFLACDSGLKYLSTDLFED